MSKGLTYGPNLHGWLDAGGNRTTHSPAIQRMIDGCPPPVPKRVKELVNDDGTYVKLKMMGAKNDVVFQINGVRRLDVQDHIREMVDEFGDETVIRCLSHMIKDLSNSLKRRG